MLDSQQVIGLFVFVTVVAFVGVTTLSVIVNRLWQNHVDRRKNALSSPLTILQKSTLVTAALGIMCIVHGYFEPYSLSVTHLTIPCSKLSKGSTIRVVHISDLHCEHRVRLESKLPEAIASEKPDLICFTGDCLNNPNGLTNFQTCMRRIAAIAPTYGVRGNWDVWYWNKIDVFGGTGVRELTDKAIEQTVRGNQIWIGGKPIEYSNNPAAMMKSTPPNAVRIFLFHFPEFIEDMRSAGVDLYLAGHTHGGQIALPFYGAILTMSTAGKKFESGHYISGDTHLYVNRGIGMEGGIAPRVRFCAPPEITVIDLVSSR